MGHVASSFIVRGYWNHPWDSGAMIEILQVSWANTVSQYRYKDDRPHALLDGCMASVFRVWIGQENEWNIRPGFPRLRWSWDGILCWIVVSPKIIVGLFGEHGYRLPIVRHNRQNSERKSKEKLESKSNRRQSQQGVSNGIYWDAP